MVLQYKTDFRAEPITSRMIVSAKSYKLAKQAALVFSVVWC